MANTVSSWSTDLNARSAPRVSYAYLGPDEGSWEPDGAGLEIRDLNGGPNTDDRVGARDVRAAGGGAGASLDWRAHSGDFMAIYLRSGSVRLETEDETFELGPEDFAYIPPLHRYRAELSVDAVFIEVTSPCVVDLIDGEEVEAIAPSPSSTKPFANRHAPGKYVSDGGPLSRTFFSYRDLGTNDVTEGRIMCEVLRAVEPADRTGWHTHSMGQIALILQGKAMIQVEHHSPVALVGHSICYIGSRQRHDVYAVDDDYALLEIYMPADWDTIPCAAPPDAAPR